jgi:hypothetical protein
MRRTAGGSYGAEKLRQHLAAHAYDPVLDVGEAWADAALADVAAGGEPWYDLVAHACAATGARPNARWEKRTRDLVDRVGVEAVRRTLLAWVRLAGRPRTVRLEPFDYGPDPNDTFDPHNATALRGVAWLLGMLPPDAETARVLAGLVEACLRKVPGVGPRNPKVANAAVYALSRLDGDDALGQLARLASRVTFKGTLKEITAALDARAAAAGLTRDEVEELAVPTYGLTSVGQRTATFGDVTADVRVVSTGAAVTWRNAAGKVVRSPPASVRAGHAEELAELKAAVKDIEKMLAAQIDRLDRQFLGRREWPYPAWRARYLDHPLLGTVARRMIWVVDGTACGWADGDLRAADDTPVQPADPAAARVRLWHPIDRDTGEVLDWRAFLERHGIVQPLRQAHRELYVLTPAEEATGTYSNRYAAHVLRQHQFHALAAVRGWRNKLRLMVDDVYPPAVRELPAWGLRAEFRVEGIGDDFATDVADSGSYLRITTDQVRFYPIDAPEHMAQAGTGQYVQWLRADGRPAEAVPLREVPPLALSEVLRDIDLFVGVASVGNDPTWQDGGPGGRFLHYWSSYNTGELTATARTRRELLTRIVPRLAIADRAEIGDRFLRVRGDIRTYKIHLGSGNILMEPDDRYLCIVPGQTGADPAEGVFLPFEGDAMLGVILSKALLLARDTRITDPTITRQIGRSPAAR